MSNSALKNNRPQFEIIHGEGQNGDQFPDEITGLNQFEFHDLQDREILQYLTQTLLKTLKLKDEYTYYHSIRVAQYAMTLGNHLNLSEELSYELELSSLFHDIGKIGIAESILTKPFRLSEEEFELMKLHPVFSWEVLKEYPGLEKIAVNARHHHERFDGKGYPDKLAGEDIPICSRIILIADTFDAITSSRVYRKGLETKVAFDELKEYSRTQFDPFLANQFMKAMRKYFDSEQGSVLRIFPDEKFRKVA